MCTCMFVTHSLNIAQPRMYKVGDNKNGTGYGNGTNVNLNFFDIIYYFAVVITFKCNIYVH